MLPAPTVQQTSIEPPREDTNLDHVIDSVRISELLDFDVALDGNIDGMYAMEWNNERAIPISDILPMGEVGRDVQAEKDVCWYEFPSSIKTSRSPVSKQAVRITVEEGSYHLNEIIRSLMRNLQPLPFDKPGWQEINDASSKLPNLYKRKPVDRAGSLFTRNFLWSTLKSQAFDFENGVLPSFVHRQSSPEICLTGDVAESLANCRSILSMYRQRTPACARLVLKTLLLEIQSTYEQVRSLKSISLFSRGLTQ